MQGLIKWIWIVVFAIFVMGMVSLIPYDKYQRAYFEEIYMLRSIPQQRIDATYKYIEAIEDGYVVLENVPTKPPMEYYKPKPPEHSAPKKAAEKPYAKPLFIRDKHNPNILHPYKGN